MGFFDRFKREQPKALPEFTDGDFLSKFGHGSGQDRSSAGKFHNCQISVDEAVELYEGSGLVEKAVSGIYDDALRNGWDLVLKDGSPEENAAIQHELQTWVEDTKLMQEVKKTFSQNALFGGSVLMHIDEVDQNRPYNERTSRGFRLKAFAPQEVTATDIEKDPRDRFFGLPRGWRFAADNAVIDASWCYVQTTPRILSGINKTGWIGPSVLTKFYNEVRRYGLSTQTVCHLLQNHNRWAYKVEGAERMAMAGHMPRMLERLHQIEAAFSSFNPALLSSKEEMVGVFGNLAGIKDVMDQLVLALCGSTQIPATVLFGVSPGGFGTGESELAQWYARAENVQTYELRPCLRWIFQRLFASGQVTAPNGDWTIEFRPVAPKTSAQKADERLKTAQTDATYIDRGVVSPVEVAQSRFSRGYSTETQLLDDRENDPFDLPNEQPEELESAETTDPAAE